MPGVTRLFVSPLALLDSGAFRAASFPRAALLFGCQLSRLDRPESRAVSFPRVARLFDSPPSLLDVWLQPDALRIENVFIRLSSPAPFRGHAASAREVASSDHFPSGLRSLIEVLFPLKKCSPQKMFLRLQKAFTSCRHGDDFCAILEGRQRACSKHIFFLPLLVFARW